VVIFDDHIETLLPMTPFTSATAQALRTRLAQVEARGSTNLSAGWLTGCQQLATATPLHDATIRLQRAVLLTDGHATLASPTMVSLRTMPVSCVAPGSRLR
jgi:Ca-activated chloride channel family protein